MPTGYQNVSFTQYPCFAVIECVDYEKNKKLNFLISIYDLKVMIFDLRSPTNGKVLYETKVDIYTFGMDTKDFPV